MHAIITEVDLEASYTTDGLLTTVKTPATNSHLSTTATCLVDRPQYSDSCLNLSTTATFFCPQDGRGGDVQLYNLFNNSPNARNTYNSSLLQENLFSALVLYTLFFPFLSSSHFVEGYHIEHSYPLHHLRSLRLQSWTKQMENYFPPPFKDAVKWLGGIGVCCSILYCPKLQSICTKRSACMERLFGLMLFKRSILVPI